MSPRTGRPKAENPKDIQLKIRADKQTIEDLDFCCEKLDKTRSDIIRLGIQKVRSEVENRVLAGLASNTNTLHHQRSPTG